MKGDQLRAAILELIDAHPNLNPSPSGNVAYALRFKTGSGLPLAVEPRGKTFQNVWVRANSVNLTNLSGIDKVSYDHTTFGTSRPNHDLYSDPAFKGTDLIRFKVDDVWQAARILFELAGPGV